MLSIPITYKQSKPKDAGVVGYADWSSLGLASLPQSFAER